MSDYFVATEQMNLKEKEDFLRELGQEEMMKVFDGWKPKNSFAKRRKPISGSPLDQKMALTVTKEDRLFFEKKLRELEKEGEDISMSQFIRNRALSSPDIFEWKNIAVEALRELQETVQNKKNFQKRIEALDELIDEERDPSIVSVYLEEQKELEDRIIRLKGVPTKRTQRLSGRVTFAESETIKWRAARLCLSTSDYLRMMIFDFEPHSEADAHMSLTSRLRFYIAIGDVAKNGWGKVPGLDTLDSSEVGHMAQRIKELEQENRQLREIIYKDNDKDDI